MVGVEVALLSHEAVAAQCCRNVVVNLVTVVHLRSVEHLLASNGVGLIETLDGALLVLVRFARQVLLPVEVRGDRVAVLILGNHVGLVAAIGWVGKTCAQNAVAHPHNKLAVLGVGNLILVHPETIDRDVFHWCGLAPQRVFLLNTHAQETAVYQRHAVRGRLLESFASAHTSHLAALLRLRHLASEAGGKHNEGEKQTHPQPLSVSEGRDMHDSF